MTDGNGASSEGSYAYRRMFFVGLGGSGGKTLRFLKRDLNAWLEARGWRGGIPQGWQFLHIDTPTVADGAEVPVPMLPDNEYLGLVNDGETMDNLDAGLFPPHNERRAEGMSWRVVPQSVNVNIQIGAGQYRAIGRSVALAYMQPIREALRGALDRLNQPGAQASLSRLYTHVHGTGPSTNVAAPIVVVASSLAGGTGAGLINDVCDILRELDSDAGESFGILYTPDVFHELMSPGSGGGGMNPNSLAAFSEVLNGHWWHGGAGGSDFRVPRKNSPVMISAGAIQSINRTGPAYPFLVGRTNSSGISYEKSLQLFEIVGAALTTWATDITVQSEFLAYTVANWRAAATKLKVEPHAIVNKGNRDLNEVALNAFNALGFARVSLGNRYFANYAAERITRDAVEFLADSHLVSGEAQNYRLQHPQITSPELIDRQAETRVDSFMRVCGLNVLDRQGEGSSVAGDPFTETEVVIRPASMQEHFDTVLSDAEREVTRTGSFVPEDWMRWIEPAVRDAALRFDELCAPEIEANVLAWISERPSVVAVEVSKLVSEVGLPVAHAVVEKMIQRLTSRTGGIVSRLREARTAASPIAAESYWREQALQRLNSKNRKAPHSSVVNDAVYYGLWSAVYGTGSKVKDVTADLTEQFAVGFLQPLAQALQVSIVNLDVAKNLVSSWPNWPQPGTSGSLSEASRPPMSEYTVVNSTRFPRLFDELLERTVAAGLAQDQVRRQKTRASVIVGDFLDSLMNADLSVMEALESIKPIVVSGAWMPDLNRHLSSPRPVISAAFRPLGFDVDTLRLRAEQWLRQPNSPFASFIGTSLRAYLDSVDISNQGVSAADMQQRQADFMLAFESAVDASKPLAELDQQLMVVLYPGQPHPMLEVEVSTLPFENHPLQETLSEMVKGLSGKQSVSGYFKPDSQIMHIDITTSLAGPYPIIAISSLLAPIAEAWQSLSASRRADFWDKRRARRLDEFIPAPQEHILCMLRGWFLGSALGLVIPSRSGGSFEVAPRGRQPGHANWELPRVLLSSSDEWGDEPALVLESLGLAYVDVGVQNSLEPLAGYINLFELGRPGMTDQMDGSSTETISDYPQLADFARRWIEEGDCKLESGADMRDYCLVDGASAGERRENLATMLDDIRRTYREMFDEYVTTTRTVSNSLTLPPYWPSMHSLIDKALAQLVTATRPTDGPGQVGRANFLPPKR